MITNYTTAIILTKHTNLSSYFDAKYQMQANACATSVGFNQLKHHYSREREVRLILLVRYEHDSTCHTYCKIKCPISPLPIRGEFEVVSLTRIIKYLEGEGWHFKQNLPISLLK